ncbi:BTAD domain-containing putative transcriptional regulator [Micromonospora sp. NPDC047465]|uniref:AfsR/SARP family transcriptional regulator n=1 Tax=Micromonospora sp. NPDC047465 TaxID=3154813 RepID=UPI0033F8AFAB
MSRSLVDRAVGGPGARRSAGAVPPSPVSVTLFGCFRLVVGGEDVALPLGVQRLVALLALRGRAGRSRLAGQLWPDTEEDRALASLRTAMWRANRAVPGLVAGVGPSLDLGPAVTVDARDLVRVARRLTQGDRPGPEAMTCLPDNDAELLPDWDDEWLVDERERMRQLCLHVQEAFADHLAADGHFGLALEVAFAVLRHDALRESAHRSVIRIHLAEGNVSEARRAYATCQRVLQQELGIPPSPATARMMALPPERGVHRA